MPRQLKLVRHLSLAEMAARHDSAADRGTRARWRALYWLAWGATGVRAAGVSGYSPKWVGQLARRYNRDGPAAVTDQRHRNRGALPLLTAEQCARLTTRWRGPPRMGGCGRAPRWRPG
jgi:hypothetical protein